MHHSKALLAHVLLIALAAFAACAQQTSPAPDEVASRAAAAEANAPALLPELGSLHHEVTTSSPEAQRYFDQGLILTYGFNHAAAVRSFAYAEELDPSCAMCAWGQALALGPNINAPMGPEAGRAAYAAAQRALAAAPQASEREQAYVAAIATRYAAEPAVDRSALDAAYADAMGALVAEYPEDIDAAVLCAEALMDLSPWNYWTAEGEPRPHTDEVLSLLEGAIARDPEHVGANHYYIHAVEEHYPERGVPAAERLGGLAPDAGHLVHMPSHIFWRVGRYGEATEINQRAAAADEQFFATCRPSAFYRAAYYPHNLHFLWAAAAAEGRSELALVAARKLEAKTKGQLEQFDFMQEFLSIPTVTLLRFGRFDEVLGMPLPAAEHRYLRGIAHYARGIASVRGRDLSGAERALFELRTVQQDPATAALVLSGGVATAAELLAIGQSHLEGELAAARGQGEAAVAALEDAVARQDTISYMEPPPWYFPTRQALGAVLLDLGRDAEAEATYRKDLELYPSNGWSLYGLSRALEAQGKSAEASWARQGFDRAFASADVTLEASRF